MLTSKYRNALTRVILSPLLFRLAVGKQSLAFITAPTARSATTTYASPLKSFVTKPHPLLISRVYLSSSSTPPPTPVQHVDKKQFTKIISDVENGDGDNYLVIDVRNVEEIMATGKVSDVAETLPLPYIVNNQAFQMEADDFEDAFGFEKPTPDRTLVFTCKAGIRSSHAAQFAAMAGYTNLVNYMGGADEWFDGGGAAQW